MMRTNTAIYKKYPEMREAWDNRKMREVWDNRETREVWDNRDHDF